MSGLPMIATLFLLIGGACVFSRELRPQGSNEDSHTRNRRSDDLAAQQAVVDQLAEKVNQLTADVSALKNQMQTAQRTVAFDTLHDGDFALSSGTTVVYNHINTNIGNGYDGHTGFFTAPVGGVYHISLHCLSPGPDTPIELDILVNDQVVAECVSLRAHGVAFDEGSTETTRHLAAGSRVWVRTNNHQFSGLTFTGGLIGTTFSGFLISADP